jgi:hypothetical protein
MANPEPASNGRCVPPAPLQERVRLLIRREGSVAAAAKVLGLSTHGALSIAARALCNPGTVTQADVRAPR